jgi:hypothetical protein
VTPVIREIEVVDDAAAWREAGFAVGDDGTVTIGRTVVRLVPPHGARRDAGDGGPGARTGARRPGIAGWTLAGLTGAPGDLDGLPTVAVDLPDDDAGVDDGAPPPGAVHPNGVTHIDHVVVTTPDLDRTTAALEAAGIVPRRTREAGTGPDGVAGLQRFSRLGDTILELVGPAVPASGGAPDGARPRTARFWGLAYVAADLDAVAALLGDRLSPPRDAVQPGRRIALLRRHAGAAVPMAFLTPDRPDTRFPHSDH